MKAWEHVTHISDIEKAALSRHLKINPTDVQGPITGTLICWDSGRGTPLFPWPGSKTGGRLLTLSKIPAGVFLGRLHRKSMFRDGTGYPVNEEASFRRAAELTDEFPEGHRVVLVGELVARSFLFDDYWIMKEREGVHAISIPDPNDMANTTHPGKYDAICAAIQWAANYTIGTKNAGK